MDELSDQALADFVSIALEALRNEEDVVKGGMRAARQEHNFYVETATRQPRHLGLASVREEGAGWAIFRALLRSRYPSKHAVEVLWEEQYQTGREARADFLFRTRDANGSLRLLGCAELKWAAYPERVLRQDAEKMCTNCQDAQIRKFVLVYGVEAEGAPPFSAMLGALKRVGLRTRPEWHGPPSDPEDLYLALAEVSGDSHDAQKV